jgi:glyoxylase-like metal-dependent hydrolase (beta-lactamase superfamily II)
MGCASRGSSGDGRHNPGMSLPAFVEPLDQGLYAIDTGFHRDQFDAAYLMVQNGRAAFIDTGTNFSVPRLLAALDAVGLQRDAVDWVIPTHVHLDHAGGVGLLMSELPQARALVHPRGARHMVDPSALYQGALAVYGQQEMDRAYGQLVPVDAARVVSSADDMTVELAGRALTLIDTPGHARHHHCIWDETTRGWFTGDTFGLSYREFDTAQGAWILPTSTPVQFEPEALARSIDRLLARAPQWVYLTHYGRVGQVAARGQTLQRLLDETVTLARRLRDHPHRHEALKSALHALYVEDLRRHGAAHSADDIARLLSIDIELNAQGIATWLDRQR